MKPRVWAFIVDEHGITHLVGMTRGSWCAPGPDLKWLEVPTMLTCLWCCVGVKREEG